MRGPAEGAPRPGGSSGVRRKAELLDDDWEGGPLRGGSSGVRRKAELLDDDWEGGPRCTGRVTAFDEDRGLGVITGADGTDIGFHCTAIVDGSRTIDVGAHVSYLTRARHLGRWEATDLQPA